MTAPVKIKSELQAALDVAQAVMTTAEEEKRELSAEERTKIDAHLAKARDLRDTLTRATDLVSLQEEVKTLLAANGGPSSSLATISPSRVGTLGVQFVGSPAFEFIRAGHARGGAWVTPSVDLLAATLTEDPASGGKLLVPQYSPGILGLPIAPPTVIDLLAKATTDATSIVYMVEKTAVNAAAPVLEGGLKPESTLTFDSVTDAVKKIATWLPVSEEMLADVSQIQSYIDQRLRQFVAIALETQVLVGDGVGAALLGITNRPGLAPTVTRGATELNALAIYRQIVEIMTTSMIMPDGVVLSPRAWAACVAATNAQGVFYGPGMFAGLPSPSLWGLPVALSSRLDAETEGLVGSFKMAAQLWLRSAITVQASNSHSDYFVKNLVAIRAEQRAALAVYRPGAFGLVAGLETLAAPVALGTGRSPALGDGGANGGTEANRRGEPDRVRR